MSDGLESAAVFRLTLSAPASTAAAPPARPRPEPSADGERDEELARHCANRICQRPALLDRGGDIEDDELVDAFAVVAPGELRGIARRAQALEVDALDHLPVAHVEAGDDALRDHGSR